MSREEIEAKIQNYPQQLMRHVSSEALAVKELDDITSEIEVEAGKEKSVREMAKAIFKRTNDIDFKSFKEYDQDPDCSYKPFN